MRVANAVLGAILIFFAVLQYNDPDALWWSVVYLIAAAFPLLAIGRNAPLWRLPVLRLAGGIVLVLFLLGFASLLPTIGTDWIHVEEAREALGYLICAGAVGFALYASGDRAARPRVIRS
jgi:drug/metabolite transporter (DMT)-like permease